MIKARCPECDGDAELDDDATHILCKKCGYRSSYDIYIESMKARAQGMASDYVPDRPGL